MAHLQRLLNHDLSITGILDTTTSQVKYILYGFVSAGGFCFYNFYSIFLFRLFIIYLYPAARPRIGYHGNAARSAPRDRAAQCLCGEDLGGKSGEGEFNNFDNFHWPVHSLRLCHGCFRCHVVAICF